jgi:hypothetical protein
MLLHPVMAVTGAETLAVMDMRERAQIDIGAHNDIAAVSAVAAVRAAVVDILLPPERRRPVAALTRFYMYLYFVFE